MHTAGKRSGHKPGLENPEPMFGVVTPAFQARSIDSHTFIPVISTINLVSS